MSKIIITFDHIDREFLIALPEGASHQACLYVFKWIFEQRLGLNFRITDRLSEIMEDNQIVAQRIEFCHLLREQHIGPHRKSVYTPNGKVSWLLLDDHLATNIPKKLPIIFGDDHFYLAEDLIFCGGDLIGTIFYLLSRYEEVFSEHVDKYGRFDFQYSESFRLGILDIPLADYYVEFIWGLLKKMWPFVERKKSWPTVWVTCDVDWPIDVQRKNPATVFNKSLGFLKNYSGRNSFKAISNTVRQIFEEGDLYLARIGWIMDVNERANRKVMFFFIPLVTSKYDPPIDFFSEAVQALVSQILARGHDVGIHPGYETAHSQRLFMQSICQFKKSINMHLPNHDFPIVCRQHFLRWTNCVTPLIQEKVGVDIDSSLAFAGRAGFRAGTCNAFPMFSFTENRQLNLVQKPLIVMESTVIHKRYEGLGYSNFALERFLGLKQACRAVGGTFTFLWHNSNFVLDEDETFYLELIS